MYALTEVFRTLQGEGSRAGTVATFVRFAACNLWSGKDEDRQRDAERHGVKCPEWCDTDFAPREKMNALQLVKRIEEVGHSPLIVFTGGEPLLQLDEPLLNLLNARMYADVLFAVETNGTVLPPPSLRSLIDHVCVSPKVPVERLALREGDELKVVYPAYNPLDYGDVADNFNHLFVSPEASTSEVGVSVIEKDNEQRAAEFCLAHPRWRLSLQTHKHLGLP